MGLDRSLVPPGNGQSHGAPSAGRIERWRHRVLLWHIPVGPRCYLGQQAAAPAWPRLVGLGLTF